MRRSTSGAAVDFKQILNAFVAIICGICFSLGSTTAEGAPVADPVHTLILVRHGAYDEAASDNPSAPLTPLGIAQARLTAARLSGFRGGIASIVFSTMTRAHQTADAIDQNLTGVPEAPTDLLRECTPPFPRKTKLSKADADEATQCARRLDQAFATYFRPVTASRTDLLVCHGNVIRYLLMKALGADPQLWTHLSVGHASLTTIEVRGDGSMRVLTVGDIGHLPPNMQSGFGSKVPELTAQQQTQ